MNKFISCLSVLLCLLVPAAQGQLSKYYISAPTDLKEAGMNKVLCMKSGNTMLFHFEPVKPLTVKIYDTLHKEIATQQQLCHVLDVNVFDRSVFKGLYDINGEAVLFVEQTHANKRVLVRVRFNSETGNIINETVLAESTGTLRPAAFYIMKDKAGGGYSLFYFTDDPEFKKCTAYVEFFNNKHESQKKVALEFDRKAYDYTKVVGAESQPNGNCITLEMAKLVTSGTVRSAGNSTKEVYDRFVTVFYIPENTTVVRQKTIDLSTETFPYCASYTYNPFAQTLNLLLFNYKEMFQQSLYSEVPDRFGASLLLNLDESDMTLKHNWIKNQAANDYYRQHTDTTQLYEGVPIKMFTNENGLSTIISQGSSQFHNVRKYECYFGKICITQCDDEGKELWGVVLPGGQYISSSKRYYSARQLADWWQHQAMFDDLAPEVYNRQFLSLNTYSYKNNCYIIYNDYDKNFNNSITHPGDTVYTFDNTNAFVYKLNKKKEVTKSYLFGEPVPGEYNTSFIESADFDEQKGTYVTLLRCRKNNETTLCMAWCQL